MTTTSEIVDEPVNKIISKTCDVCQTEISAANIFEFQEMITISWTCGYGSIMPDGNQYQLDMCQKCVKDMLFPHATLASEGNY